MVTAQHFLLQERPETRGKLITHTISLFLNDLEGFLLRGNNFGIKIFDYSLQCYLKLVVLLYADDMVLFAESMEELQDLLDKFQIYCSQWKLKVNSEKSKVVIFGDNSRH